MTGRGPLRQGGLGRANNPRLELAEPVGDGRVLPVIGLPAYGSARAAVCARWNVRVTGVGGALSVEVAEVAPVDGYRARGGFDLIVMATKAHDAIEAAPRLSGLVGPGGTLLPIQNGAVAQAIADRLADDRVLGGLSNLGATMTAPGVYEQRNAGHLLIGELAGSESERAERVRRWLGRAVEVRVTPNIRGAVWSKVLLNCSVTTIGAIAGRTMREYIASPGGRELFRQLGVRTPANAAIVEAVHAIERRQIAPGPALLGRILQASVAA